ncbi:MAG: HAMP domain-containing protein, partial [Trueperaceae bacterium]|nr:HAMP domain-containing protein [Trueperaceae bacterium]
MNRLSTRLLLAMVVVALVSLLAVPVATMVADRAALATLPEVYRVRVQADTPLPGTLRWWLANRRPAIRPAALPPGASGDPARLQAEVERLVTFVGDSRAARRDATVVGVLTALLLGVALAAWLSRSIARPIAAVSAASSQLAAGRFGTRVELPRRATQPVETRALTDGFNAMSEALERYEGERKAMVADVAHELRTPLAALRLRLEALEDGLVPLSADEVRRLRGHADLLARLVDDLRLLSLADAGRLTLEPVAVDLGAWLESAVEAARDGLRPRGVGLAVRGPVSPVTVRVDPQRMVQVLHNLIDNAARYAPGGTDVEIAVARDGDEVRLTVRDRGPGIPESELETIFDRFVTGARRDERGASGSGLGLAIVRMLVDLHGGRVEARNLDTT